MFHFTDYDGRKYFDLMQKNQGTYETDKYFVQLVNPSNKFEKFGQLINVKLPWINTNMTQEYLMNIDAISEIFKP